MKILFRKLKKKIFFLISHPKINFNSYSNKNSIKLIKLNFLYFNFKFLFRQNFIIVVLLILTTFLTQRCMLHVLLANFYEIIISLIFFQL